jgi:hypothetical protein
LLLSPSPFPFGAAFRRALLAVDDTGGEHPAFGAVDFVHAIAFSHRAALTAAWQIEVLREHIARIAIGRMIAFAATATAAAASVAEVVAIAVV